MQRAESRAVVEAFVEILLEARGVNPAEQPLISRWMEEAILAWQKKDIADDPLYVPRTVK